MTQSTLAAPADSPALLTVDSLGLEFGARGRRRGVLHGVALEVARAEIVGVVGESGSGKSLTLLSILGLLPPLASPTYSGSIRLEGRDLLTLDPRERAGYRGRFMAYVPQEPMNSLNPTRTIGAQLGEPLRHHFGMTSAAIRTRGEELLAAMRIADPVRVWSAYPFELSGGMRQRVLIAMAFACEPRLILADEPTSALDVTVQAQILRMLRDRARGTGTAVLFVSHDLAVVSQLCDRVYVMYGGTVVEHGDTARVLHALRHPYTRALLASRPAGRRKPTPLRALPPGAVPTNHGCGLQERCPVAIAACAEPPPLVALGGSGSRGHAVACWRQTSE